jgi:hypothetical protein
MSLLHRDLPAPPDVLRVGPFKEGSFTSDLHDVRIAARLGRILGIAFTICFLTGLFSHLQQHEPSWLDLPTRPSELYRYTQGLHVATGIACVPLLLAKFWSVYPQLFAWPPAKNLAHGIERASLFLLVGGSLFQLTSGLLNIAQYYGPMGFNFTTVHYWVAYVTMGALALHVGAKITLARAAWKIPLDEQP